MTIELNDHPTVEREVPRVSNDRAWIDHNGCVHVRMEANETRVYVKMKRSDEPYRDLIEGVFV